jgi:hypothetical protein
LFEEDLELEEWPWIVLFAITVRMVVSRFQCFIVEFYYREEGLGNMLFKSPSYFGCERLPKWWGLLFEVAQKC